jgi:hypothetical protein
MSQVHHPSLNRLAQAPQTLTPPLTTRTFCAGCLKSTPDNRHETVGLGVNATERQKLLCCISFEMCCPGDLILHVTPTP